MKDQCCPLYGEFIPGRSSFQNEGREGRPKSDVVLQTIDAWHELILQDFHVTYLEIEALVGPASIQYCINIIFFSCWIP